MKTVSKTNRTALVMQLFGKNSGVRVTRSLVLCVMFCRSLFLLFFFFWPLCCMSYDLRILITPLVSSNSSCIIISYLFSFFHSNKTGQLCNNRVFFTQFYNVVFHIHFLQLKQKCQTIHHICFNYYNKRCEFESHSREVYSIKHSVIKFVSDLRQVGGFLQFPPSIKLMINTIRGENSIFPVSDISVLILEVH